MLCKIYSATTIGIDGELIQVEVDVAERGFPTFTIVGLASQAVEESKERVRTAIKNSSFSFPETRIVVNLAPADIPKGGSLFDLPIAIGILSSSGMIKSDIFSKSLFVGELSLDGKISPVHGILPITLFAKQKGLTHIFIPEENKKEAALVSGITIFPVSYLHDLVLHLNEEVLLKQQEHIAVSSLSLPYLSDFESIQGQLHAKRALEIAAAGFHNIYLKGPPGTGKTMLARAFPSILPTMEEDEMVEVAKIYSVYQGFSHEILLKRPFRSPHHTTSRVGLMGGGAQLTPGEISLAHRGVLFLDELPEFPRSVLESLRQPLEDGKITLSRAHGSITFPSRFLLLAAANPCPCGYFGHPKKACTCPPWLVDRYKKRVSGPMLDRIDLHIDVPFLEQEKLLHFANGEKSELIQKRVSTAWEKQKKRFKNTKLKFNGEMNSSEIKEYCVLNTDAKEVLKNAILHLSLSARGYFKLIKIAQTICDLSEEEHITGMHLAEALQYRSQE